jgi:hypothetical protein
METGTMVVASSQYYFKRAYSWNFFASVSPSPALPSVNRVTDARMPKDDIFGWWTSMHVGVFNNQSHQTLFIAINSGFKFSQLEMSA